MTILISLKNATLVQSFSKYGSLQMLQKKNCFINIKRHLSKQLLLENIAENFPPKIIPFNQVIKNRRDEANRSILVQVQSAQSYKELHSYCNTLGTVMTMLHYSLGVEPMHFIIVEFAKESEVENVFNTSSYIEESQIVPVQSPFLWFRASSKKHQSKLKISNNIKLTIENGTCALKDTDVQDAMRGAQSVSDQMIQLHNMTTLNDVGTRLRFLVAKQIENAVLGMFPTAKALPFGSSVNGFGKMSCDLDLVLRLNHNAKQVTDTRLVYHCKATMGSERSTSQRHMEAIGDLIQLFLPGCSQVRRILQARVPIIKYYQQLTDVECDLSMANLSGHYMSDFLYSMGSMDERVRPLVFAVRTWAAQVGLTNSSPGRWISNFSLTLLVLAFLQSNSQPILPSLNTLVKMAGPEDKFLTEDGINCTFLRDINKYLAITPIENKDNLKALLQQFFEFYSQFDFSSKAICLNEAVAITKPEHSALYIVNPLERGLNVSKNVSIEELEKFRIEVRNAAWILESEETASPNWGLLSLFQSKKRPGLINNSNAHNHYTSSKSKLLEVSKLFDDEGEKETVFKNEDVRRQVDLIKKQSKAEMKKFNTSFDFNSEKSGR